MISWLAQSVVVAAVLTVLATICLFTVTPSRARPGRALAAVASVFAVAAGSLIVSALLGSRTGPSLATAATLSLSVLAWAGLARTWAARGVLAWALSVDVGALYLAYVLIWTLSSGQVLTVIVSLLLWLLEVFVFVLGLGYVWEVVDVVARRRWRGTPVAAMPGYEPFVSLHVPTHNEPPDMVIDTLERMQQLDYENYEILLVDNNTTDPALWRPLEEYCAGRPRVGFIHLEDWPGFKSGALNHALRERTDPRAEVIGIVDADYHVDPSFLRDNAPLFGDATVSFVQTPQDYRDAEVSSYFKRLYYSYGYFFDVSQKSRNERDGAIFGGTMGLIRRSALEDVGGWDEWCITEDAELSLRLLKAGGSGIHVDRSYGHGVMPLSFESLKRQRFRWCFGGIQILRLHWRSLLPGRRTEANQLTLSQRWAYLVGGLQWFGDLAAVLFTAFLLIGGVNLLDGGGLVVRRLSGLLLISTVTLVLLGGVRSVALLRRSSGANWREALGAFGIWLALGLTVARASWLGLVSRQGTFLRTPKVKGEPRAADALRGNRLETILAVGCAGVGTAVVVHGGVGIAVGILLWVQAVGFALAPINSYAAIRSDLTEEQRRRRGGLLSWERVSAPARISGVAVLVTSVVGLVLFFLASPVGAPDLPSLPKAFKADVAPRTSPSPSPSPTRSGVPGAAPSGTVRTYGPTSVGVVAPAGAPTTSVPAPVTTPAATRPGSRPTSVATQTPTPVPTSAPTSAPTTGRSPTTRPTQAGGKPTSRPSHP